MKTSMIVAAVLALACQLTGQPLVVAAPQAETLVDFKGKFLTVVNGKAEPGFTKSVVIEKASVRKVGDRLFVVGSLCDIGQPMGGLFKGSIRWLPLSEVLEINEFDKLETIREITDSMRR